LLSHSTFSFEALRFSLSGLVIQLKQSNESIEQSQYTFVNAL
jgi:hypothetical protein